MNLTQIICYFVACFTSVHLLTDLCPVLTYFYICSDCYYSHPTIYCKFCSWTKFLHGTINISKIICYFVRCFISLHISTELIPVCNLVLHCSDSSESSSGSETSQSRPTTPASPAMSLGASFSFFGLSSQTSEDQLFSTPQPKRKKYVKQRRPFQFKKDVTPFSKSPQKVLRLAQTL